MTLKQLEARLNKVEGFVKARSRTWLIVAGVGLVLLVILFIAVFRNKGKVDDSYLNQIRQMDSTIKYQQKYIDAIISDQNRRDSIIFDELEAIGKSKPIQKRITNDLDKIPSDVKSLDRDGFRREFTDY
jgi:Na+-transporting methylmalonyl-CoA/oxaloacetate decarboxylase gamma subunit